MGRGCHPHPRMDGEEKENRRPANFHREGGRVMTAKIRRSIDFEPEDLKWITRVVEERKKEDPAYSRNLLIGEAIAALKEKLEGDEMNMEEFAQHLGFASGAVLLEDA